MIERGHMVLTPSGEHLVVLANDIVRVVALASGDTRETEVAGARSIAVFDDHVCVAADEPPRLVAIGIDGEPIGEPLPLPRVPGRLSCVRAGRPVASWVTGTKIVEALAGATWDVREQVIDVDVTIPLQLGHWIAMRGPVATHYEFRAKRWSRTALQAGHMFADGSALFEGRGVVLRTAARQPQLIVMAVRDGALQHRLAVGAAQLCIAGRRGLAVVASDDTLELLDLRFGQLLKVVRHTDPVADLAIDEGGQLLALRAPDGAITTIPIRDLLAGGDERVEPVAAAVVEEPAAFVPAVVRAEPRAPLDVPPLVALQPRAQLLRCSAGENLVQLEHERVVMTALTYRAIATAWDSGRLAFSDNQPLPFEREVVGLLGRGGGHAGRHASDADDAVRDALEVRRRGGAQIGGRHSSLSALAAEIGLSSEARQILVAIAAPVMWADLSRLYGILCNDSGRGVVDEALLAQLLDGQVDEVTIARELDRDRPLVRYGLVHHGGPRPRPFAVLSVDPIVVHLLRDGDAATDLETGVRVVPATRTLDELAIPRDVITRLLAALAQPHDHLRLVVRGRTGSGGHTLLAALAERANRRLGVIDGASLSHNPQVRLPALEASLYRAHLRGWLPVIDGLGNIASTDAALRDRVRELLREHPGPLALRLPWDAQPPVDQPLVVDLPPLSIADRAEVWRDALADAHMQVADVDALTARYLVGPGIIRRAIASLPPVDNGESRDVTGELDEVIRKQLESNLGQVATRVTRLASWSNVVLPADVRDLVLELIARIKHQRIVFGTWGFDKLLSTSRGTIALFQGQPGTGKTLVAGAIANELGLDIYRIDLSRVMSKWIGETEQNLARVFDAAEESQAILLFDEADSLFAKRTEVRSSVDRYANLEVNFLLQRLDSYEGIAILTTNFGTAIDDAFKRRMSLRLTFPFPDEEAREQLWRAHIPAALPTAGDLKLADLARRYQLSGGYIRNAALRAAFLAAEECSPLTHEILERSIKAEYRSIGKLSEAGSLG